MLPQRALKKLQQARNHLKALGQASSGDEFTTVFSAFGAALRSIPDVLRKDLKGRPNWRNWADRKEDEMRTDELLKFFFDVRNEDLHEGTHRLAFSTYVKEFRSGGGPPGADLTICADGVYWVSDQGKPTEQREAVLQGQYYTKVSIDGPPTTHLGRPITDASPVALCSLAISYFERLLEEAERSFP